ncbi:MAG: HAMP domain-containing histidine kinase [Zoogloeaceae bacterium]|jgi:two-component system sensor histidine kinase GlrK|nr:HAMP domain-containing histidine kinase [Zoogloeaceae bacterium]
MSIYPDTLLRLVLLGSLLLMTPLVATIIYAGITINEITAQNDLNTGDANRASRLTWELSEDLRHMDRILRQYSALNDPNLLDDYAVARVDWQRRSAVFTQIPFVAQLNSRVEQLLLMEDHTYRSLGSGKGLPELQATILRLREQNLVLVEETARIVDAERSSFRAKAADLHKRLMIGIAIAFATVLVLMLIGQRLLIRLFSRVERAVQALGQGKLERRIALRGPDDVKRIGRRLEWLRCRLRELEEQRTSVLRHVSHELKTPLAALLEGSSLLADQVAGTLTPQQNRIVGIMHNNALRLQTLIDGLLRLQQAGHTLERIERIQLRFDHIIEQVLATQQLAVRDKRLRILGTLTPLIVTGGKEEITTIVNNLVTNAIKYSPAEGTIKLLLAQDGDQAVLDVMDQGPGIPEESREKIFEPFFRIRETENSAAGAGLGLAIARGFVHAHHGSLNLLDSPAGSHFQVRLPLSEEEEPPEEVY